MILLLGGDVQLNPGDKWKFPCGIYTKPVKINQKGIQQDECHSWFHSKCCCISPTTYDILAHSSCTWICPQCGLPNLSDSFFDNFMDSLNSSNFFEPLNAAPPTREWMNTDSRRGETHPKSTKCKSLTCLVNCQSNR